MRFSIRLQLLLLSLFLFAIPYLGYKYVWELEQYLRIGQEQTMIGTARAVATALHERPALFDSRAAYLQTVRPGTDLYAPPIPAPIQLDGRIGDWQSVQPLMQQYDADNIVDWFGHDQAYMPVTLSFSHMVGRYQDFLYAVFRVEDDKVVWRHPNSLAVDQSDHLLIGLVDASGELHRYSIAPYRSGWVNAYRLSDEDRQYRALGNELKIQGRWQQTTNGYTIELRFPLEMTAGSLAFALVDVDDPTQRTKRYAMGTANPDNSQSMGTVITPSPEIEQILAGLQYADSRVWVVDKHKRVLAKAGSIHAAQGVSSRASTDDTPQWWQYVEENWLLPLYYNILTRPPNEFTDELANAYALAGKDISSALKGKPDSLWRLTSDNKAVILSAAYPIFIENQVMGAVVVEQTTHGIRTLRNRALEQLFHVILAVMLLGTLSLLLFANRISGRIRRLRDATEAVIDDNGKIVGRLPTIKARDEIGDLSNSFGNVLDRLHQYNSYLENMASRLSHELRTPIAVVRSSLEMVSQVEDRNRQTELLNRAQSGIHRLSNLLNSMSEATRLEQAIADEEREKFDWSAVVKSCVAGYQQAYPQRNFQLQLSAEQTYLLGAPERCVQMLDKVITNAVEFSSPQSIISLHLWAEQRNVKLSVTNTGPLLPEGMQHQLLQSMVSVRKESPEQDQSPHLGLGLYIAQLVAQFHKGSIQLTDLPDKTGVCVLISLPLTEGI